MGPYRITEVRPSTSDNVLVWYDFMWRHGYWKTRDLFVLFAIDDLPRETVTATWWAPFPPRVVSE